jgi:hypothetical protein
VLAARTNDVTGYAERSAGIHASLYRNACGRGTLRTRFGECSSARPKLSFCAMWPRACQTASGRQRGAAPPHRVVCDTVHGLLVHFLQLTHVGLIGRVIAGSAGVAWRRTRNRHLGTLANGNTFLLQPLYFVVG